MTELPEKRVLWTPYIPFGTDSCDFSVSLDRSLATDLMHQKLDPKSKDHMNNLANEDLKRSNSNWINPYSFYEDSCFLDQIYLGQNGVWLSVDRYTIDDLLEKKEKSKPVIYESHNVDTSKQAYTLMGLFSKWISYSDIMLDRDG